MPADMGRVKEIFLAAAEKADPLEREAYLREACGDDGLREQVAALLRHHDMSGSVLESPFAHSSSAITEDGPAVQPLTDDAATPAEAGGDRVGPYKLVQKLGEGGMGVVWVAEQTEPLKRRVALKLIKPGMDSAHVVRRFEAERQALAMMDHPNIAKVFDAATTAEGRPYFVMELVKGVPITKYCDELHLTVRERLELFVPVCQAIQHAHTKGVVHRDIKPSNVLVTMQDGKPVPKVIDFGIAKALHQPLTDASLHTAIGQIVGTLEYMSPEQAELSALDVDTRADVYSLGVLLYELLTGTTPLDRTRLRQEYAEMVRRIREEEPPRPSTRLTDSAETLESVAQLRRTEPQRLKKALRGDLDWIVMRCLEKDRTRRYETANGLARDVERHLADEPVEACKPSAGYRLGKFLCKHRAGVLTAAVFALLLVAATAVSAWQAMRATAERDEKEEARKEAVESEEKAILAAEAERKAKELAGRRLGQIEKANEVLATIFRDLDPGAEEKGGPSLREQLSQRLVGAAAKLDGLAIDDPLTLARIQHTLGKTLNALGHYPQAIVLLSRSGDTLEAHHGSDRAEKLTIMNNLAIAYTNAGLLDKALPLFDETLEKMKAEFGADHPETLTTMGNLGGAYRAAGLLDKALPLLEETLGKRRAKLGADHPDTLIAMNNLGGAYLAAEKLDKALPLLEETLEKMKAKLGADHPESLIAMSNLADAYLAAKKLDKALPLLEETLEKRRAKLGADHPYTLIAMNNLGGAYRDAGLLGKALPLYEEALDKMRAKLGAGHPNTLIAMGNLGGAYQAAGRLDKALPLLEETLRKMKAKLGAGHPSTLIALNNLGGAYRDAGRLDKALPLYEETFAQMKAKHGADHPNTLACMGNLADAYLATGQLDKARPLLARLLEEQKAQLKQVRDQHGRDTTLAASILAVMGFTSLRQQNSTEAEPVLRECLAIREKSQPDVWSTFNTRSHLGWALMGQKKYAEAEPLLVAGYEGMKRREAKIPLAGKVRLTEALERLVELYEKTGAKDKAAARRKELEAARTAAKKKPAP